MKHFGAAIPWARLILATCVIQVAVRGVNAQQSEPPGTLPYQLAFDRANFSASGWFDISPDGKWAAYAVQY